MNSPKAKMEVTGIQKQGAGGLVELELSHEQHIIGRVHSLPEGAIVGVTLPANASLDERVYVLEYAIRKSRERTGIKPSKSKAMKAFMGTERADYRERIIVSTLDQYGVSVTFEQ